MCEGGEEIEKELLINMTRVPSKDRSDFSNSVISTVVGAQVEKKCIRVQFIQLVLNSLIQRIQPLLLILRSTKPNPNLKF